MPETEYYTALAAAEVLGVSRYRIWTMLKNGELHFEVNPLDRREKLIPKSEVDRLEKLMGSIKKAVA